MKESENSHRVMNDADHPAENQNFYRLEIDIRNGDYENDPTNLDPPFLPDDVKVVRITSNFWFHIWPDDEYVHLMAENAVSFQPGWMLHEIRGIYRT
jgi:hypothetical protein